MIKHDKTSLHQIQSGLVTVWQHYIQAWNERTDVANTEVPIPSSMSTEDSEQAKEELPAEGKGHLLQPIPDGSGMFCAKCGVYTLYLKHVRLRCSKSHVALRIYRETNGLPNLVSSKPPAAWMKTNVN